MTLQARIGNWLDLPLALLALVWTGLVVAELTLILPPEVSERILQVDFAIWFVFALVFVVEFLLAPEKLGYLRANLLAGLSVVLPFVRVVRVVRLVRLLRSVSLVRIVLVANRASGALAELLSEHQFQYVVALVALVTLLGAAGVFFFERGVPGTDFPTFGEALWWAASLATTVNIGAEPVTPEGRVIALLLRAVAVAVFGYVAGSIASFLVGRRVAGREEGRLEREAILRLAEEVRQLRAELRRSRQRSPKEGSGRDEAA